MRFSVSFLISVFSLTSLLACSSAQKKTPELGSMEGRKVALVEVEGEATPRRVVEVALINQLVQRGTFDIISKQDIETARKVHNQDPTDWKGIAARAGAEYALRAKVLQFDADTREGVSTEVIEDSQRAAEMGGDDAKTERVFKVKSLTGHVRVQLDFTRLAKDGMTEDTRSAVAEAQDQVVAEAKTAGISLPPKMRFLETLSNQAFKKFFEQYD